MDHAPPRRTLHRNEHTHHLRFLTFSTYQRCPLFNNDRIKDLFAARLAHSRAVCRFHLYAWVIMPEHVHLLLWPRLPEWPIPDVLEFLKSPFASDILARWRALDAPVLARLSSDDGPHFWQAGGGYDRNIWSPRELAEKVRYIHNNPVKRSLCREPTDWAWSSARWFAGDRTGPVPIDPFPPQRPT